MFQKKPGDETGLLKEKSKARHFDLFDFRLLPAFFNAMATACFCGLPAFFSLLMFELMVFREDPFLRGISMAFHSCGEQKS